MEDVMKKFIFPSRNLLPALIFMALAPVLATAEPIGPVPEFNEAGGQLMAASGKTRSSIEENVPSRETVGLPVYPGSFFTGAMESSGLASVVMASADPVDTVRDWYAAQPGLSYDSGFVIFYVGDKYQMMVSETVYLTDISEKPSETLGGLMFDMDGMKTQITISYEP